MEQHIMQAPDSGDRYKGVVGIGFHSVFQYSFHPRRLSQLKMKTSKNTLETSASINKRVYCTKCKSPFTGKKGLDRHLKRTKAHSAGGFSCYIPRCSTKPYQKFETLHTHVGRAHREEIGRFNTFDSTMGLKFSTRGPYLGKRCAAE
jgi:hypothetical protein